MRGEQQSDKEELGQIENTHQNSSKFYERTGERFGKRKRCRGKTDHLTHMRKFFMHDRKQLAISVYGYANE